MQGRSNCAARGLSRRKRWVPDSGIHVPLIVRWQGKIKPGSVREDLVSFIDFAPTVLALANAAGRTHPWLLPGWERNGARNGKLPSTGGPGVVPFTCKGGFFSVPGPSLNRGISLPHATGWTKPTTAFAR